MLGQDLGNSKEEISQALTKKAADLWGEKRAQEITGGLDQISGFLERVAQNPPDKEEEPAFFW